MDELIKYFDYTYYITKYPDLKNLNFLKAKWHCFGDNGIGDGIKEGRIFCKQLELFNKNKYLNNISKNSNLIEIYLNYIKNYKKHNSKENDNNKNDKEHNSKENDNNKNDKEHNSKENENNKNDIIKKYFNEDFYLKNYNDLNKLNKSELFNHFINNGIKEERIICKQLLNFNYLYYKNKYSECNNYTFIECCLDYLTNGINKKYEINEIKDECINKDTFRDLCFQQIINIRQIEIPTIKLNLNNETFLIEFRILPHLEFLIRNTIIKLPNWSHTVVCGNMNYEYLHNMCNNISINIKIIKLDINICNVNKYNNLLLTKDFWNNFVGEKLLLYQEDSILFHNKIQQFMKYDYIGAPWLLNNNDNINQVGNGGFSLRSKSKMIKVLNTIDIKKLKLNNSTLESMKIADLEQCPEDVYFSKSMIDFQLGNVANRHIANLFSSEQIFYKDSLGGHNYYLGINNINLYKYIFYSKFLKCVLFYSPYEYSIGGGEKYLSYLMKYFIDKEYYIIIINNTNITKFNNTLKFYFNEIDIKKIFKINYNENIFKYDKLCDYYIYMSNNSNPDMIGVGKKNIYHCQFPFNEINNDNIIIDSYSKIIVNSEYTKDNLKKHYLNSINILYPPCIIEQNKVELIKNDKQFVMIGRIFKYEKYSNNKYFNEAIDVFNNFPELKLYIIGSNKDMYYYKQLKSLIKNNNIKILADISNDKKNEILKTSKYFISLTGIKDIYNYNYEHFGISYIEALNYNCYPISYYKGFPSIHIDNTLYGSTIHNVNDLSIILDDILKYNDKYLNKNIDLNKYTNISFLNTLNEIINN
mgnify:CR=1 FL=1